MTNHFPRPDYRQADHTDFVVRENKLKLWHAVGVFLIAFLLIFMTSEARDNIGGTPVFLLVLLCIISGMAWFTVYFIQTHRDMVLATEFQNALFANAAGLNTRFCFIIKRDGTIVYFDPGFQKVFPQFAKHERRNIDVLLAVAGIAKEDSERVLMHLERGTAGRVIFPMQMPDGPRTIVLTMDPLPRPSGFYLLRGREFVEPRQKDDLDLSPRSSPFAPELLDHILHSLPVGIVAADATGRVKYVSNALAESLGYTDVELIDMPLPNLIHQMGLRKPGDISYEHFEGEVLLQRKNGSMQKTTMVLQPFVDPAGKLIGCSAITHVALPLGETEAVKKKVN